MKTIPNDILKMIADFEEQGNTALIVDANDPNCAKWLPTLTKVPLPKNALFAEDYVFDAGPFYLIIAVLMGYDAGHSCRASVLFKPSDLFKNQAEVSSIHSSSIESAREMAEVFAKNGAFAVLGMRAK